MLKAALQARSALVNDESAIEIEFELLRSKHKLKLQIATAPIFQAVNVFGGLTPLVGLTSLT